MIVDIDKVNAFMAKAKPMKRNDGTIERALQVAKNFVLTQGKPAYVYFSTSYGTAVWQVTGKLSSASSIVNNPSRKFIKISPDLNASHEGKLDGINGGRGFIG